MWRYAVLPSSTEFVSAFRFSFTTRSIDTVHGSQEFRFFFFVSPIRVLVEKCKRGIRFHEYFGPITCMVTRISAAGTLIYFRRTRNTIRPSGEHQRICKISNNEYNAARVMSFM